MKTIIVLWIIMSHLFHNVVHGYRNILLIGSRKDTYPLARHYSNFYNIPLLESGFFYPNQFIMITEDEKQNIYPPPSNNLILVEWKDYPQKKKENPNYFISWLKQTVL